MINLFEVRNRVIDTSEFTNLLHSPIVTELEESIAKYVGAKYSCAINSCTSALYLSLKLANQDTLCTVPTLVTTRFLGAILQAGSNIRYMDDVDWIGREYILWEEDFKIIDSAHKVEPNQFTKECRDKDLLVISFYPTKPIGGLQGGMVLSNDKWKIDWIRQAANFGEDFNVNSWESKSNFIGYQKYMNSVNAYMALESFKEYPEKRKKLDKIRKTYNRELASNNLDNGSYHLYRIEVLDNDKFLERAKERGIICGIHYKPAHRAGAFSPEIPDSYPKSEEMGSKTVSLPFHINLTDKDLMRVVEMVYDIS